MDAALEHRTRLGVVVEPSGTFAQRWGADDPNPGNVPSGLQFSTAIPGGFKECTVTLPRKITEDYPDLALLENLKVFGPGNETAWEGRIAQLPRTHSDTRFIQVGSVGWSSHLRDDNSFTEVYVDRDFASWTSPSVQRKINLLGNLYSLQDATVQSDTTTGQPSLVTQITDEWSLAAMPWSEALYDIGSGNSVGSIYYAWKQSLQSPAYTDAGWSWKVAAGTNDTFTSEDASSELRAAGPSTGTLTAGTGRRFARVSIFYGSGAAGTAGQLNILAWTCLAVYGKHGLTLHGNTSATEAQGVYASDVIEDVVRRAAPLLEYTSGTGGTIQPSSFAIPQLAFRDPTTPEDVILASNAYHLWEWGVYDNKTFFWRQTDPDRLCYEARLSDGAGLELEGQQAESSYNGVVVRYNDPTGASFTVGPPGGDFDATSYSLIDESDTNPVNAAGIPRRWALIEVSPITTQAGAIQLGAVWLAEQAQPARRGQLTVTGEIDHPTEGKVPTWRVRAGDYVRIADFPTDVARRIIETDYDHDSRTVTCSLDNSSFKLEAFMERLGVSLIGVI